MTCLALSRRQHAASRWLPPRSSSTRREGTSGSLLLALSLALLLFACPEARADPTGSTGVAWQRNDPFAGVVGADVAVDLRLPDTPLADVLARVAEKTGLHLSAEGLAADLRVTVFAHKRPAAQVLAALATQQQLSWRREADGCVLYQTAGAKAEDEAARADILRRSADIIYRDISSEPDPQADTLHSPLARNLLASLGREGILQLLRSGTTNYAWPARPGCLPIPPAVRDHGMPVLPPDPNAPAGPARAHFWYVAFSPAMAYMQPSFNCWVYYGDLDESGTRCDRGGGAGGFVPAGTHTWMSIYAAERPSEEQASPALAQAVSFSLPDVVKPPGSGPPQPANTGLRWHTTGDALAALDNALPTDVVADSFALPMLNGLRVAGPSLRDALDEVARWSLCRWRVDGGFVMMTNRHRAMCRLTDPPVRALARLKADVAAGTYGLKDWMEVAQLPDPQFQMLRNYLDQVDGSVTPVGDVSSARSHLALWGSLSEGQRQAALAKGLPYRELNQAQRGLFLRCINSINTESHDIYFAPEGTLTALVTGAVIRAKTVRVHAWGVRGTDRSVSGGPDLSRERAALALRQGDRTPGVGEIRRGECTEYQWEYASGEQRLATGRLRTRITWLE